MWKASLISQDGHGLLATLAQQSYEQNTLGDIILPELKDQIRGVLDVFSGVAYQCLSENRKDRPTMGEIVETLENALRLQVDSYSATFVRVGTLGKQIASPDNDQWSFELEQNHKLQKITIDHGDLIYSLKKNVIYSLMFTTQCSGIFHASNKAGGSAGGDIVSEVMLDEDEEIIEIKGTIGTLGGNTVISSLTFETNKRTHGPFGRASDCVFSIPWEKGSLVGFYGLAGDFIDSIGVYLKADDKVMKVGTWGSPSPINPSNQWSVELERNHQLKEITIDHGDLICSLIFTTQYRGLKYNSKQVGYWKEGDKPSVVTFDWNEDIIGITGTVAVSRGNYPGWTIISSISFMTNKRTHGPFGTERGTPFTLQWESGSFAGFYGHCGGYVDSIGVYLKATL